MKKVKKNLIVNLTAIFLTASSSVYAGFFDVSPGKSGAAFMRVTLSARKLALGGGGTALRGADFIETNPAALYDEPTSLQFSHLMYFDSLSLNDAKFTFSIESADSYGVGSINNFLCLGLRSFSSDEDRRDMLTGIKTGSFGVSARNIFLSYAFLSDNYTGGLTVKNISESVDNNLSSAAAFDAGIIKDVNENLSLGTSARNIGKKISGSDMPLTASAGFAYRFDEFTINGDIEKTAEENKLFSAGIEYKMAPLLLRGGLNYQDILRPSTGFGASYNNFILDYAFSFHKYLGQSHLFTLVYHFATKPKKLKQKTIDIKKTKKGKDKSPKIVLAKDTIGNNIAVSDLEARPPLSESEAAFITDFLRNDLVETTKFNVVERKNMDLILIEQGFQQKGCTESDCAVQMGKILNVNLMIIGSCGKLLNRHIVTIKIVDVETGKIIYADKESCYSEESIEEMTKKLAAKIKNNFNK